MCAFFKDIGTIKAFWIGAFVIGFVFFFVGIVYLIQKKGKRDIHYAFAAFWEFLACWVLYIPEEVFNDISIFQNSFLRWIEAVLTALLKSFNVYSGNGYEHVVYASHPVFTSIYGVLRVSANIALLLFVGGFILKFLNGPLQRFKLSWSRRRYLYVFSTCNDKTLSIAKSIPKNLNFGKTRTVFACLDNTNGIYKKELVDAIGGLYINNSVLDVVKKYVGSVSGMEIFLFEDVEENNIVNLEKICLELGKVKKNNSTKIFVELSKTPWDLYDNYVKKHGLKDKGIIINFVRTEETFVYNNLLKNSIFEKALKKGNINEIRALIVGEMNARNIEMFKALMHLSQMPGYFLNLVIVENGHGRKRLKQMMPEIGECGAGYGDALYHLNYLEDIDYNSDAFENAVEQYCPEFSFAFVNAGEDLLNANLALLLKTIISRKKRKPDEYLLQVSIINKGVWEKWNEELCKGIMPVGSMQETYAYKSVTYSDIEMASEKIHNARHSSTPWIDYLNNEYNRHSVFARTLSYKYKIQILGDKYHLAGRSEEPAWSSEDELHDIWEAMFQEEKMWKTYEHMRWNMYTRTLGYRADRDGLLVDLIKRNEQLLYEIKNKKAKLELVSSGEEKQQLNEAIAAAQTEKKEVWSRVKDIRTAAKVHNDLVPFDELSLADKIKDNLVLPNEVVAVLKEI